MKSFSEYAYEILLRAGPKGMHYRELAEKVVKLAPMKGRSPDQTILAILDRDRERFEKTGRGVYRVRSTSDAKCTPEDESATNTEAFETEEATSPPDSAPPASTGETGAAPPLPPPAMQPTTTEGAAEVAGSHPPRERRPKGPKPSIRPPHPPPLSTALGSPVIEALISTANFLGASTKKSAKAAVVRMGASSIALGTPGLRFDAAAAKEMFEGGAWIPTHSVNLDELREFLPENTVSEKARRVQVWAPIKQAISKYLPQLSAVTQRAGREWYAVVGDETAVIKVHDGDESLSCTCSKFDDSEAMLCPHLLAAIYTAAPGLADAAMARSIFPTTEKHRQWKTALENLKEESEGMKSNVLYYFVKDILTGFGFRLARCETPREQAKAFVLARSSAGT